MKKYKVLVPFYKQSDKMNYSIDDVVELSDEQATILIKEKKVEALEFEAPKDFGRNKRMQ